MQPNNSENHNPSAAAPVNEEGYRTTPDQTNTGWPPGVPYIVGNEACERFSYYGMRAILYAHLVSLYAIAGSVADEAERSATATTHLFFAGVYALPMIGAIIADRWAGKYKTILYLSLVYCAGHGVLALWDNHLNGMYLGLALIAIGSGGIKPCVSANVGDQFGKANWFRVRTIFQIFYFSINFGSFFSTILIPITKQQFGASVAFGIPGVLMFLATLIFWMGRKKYVHVPPRPGGKIGLLDTLSSTFLFLSVGHFFFIKDLPPQWLWVQVAATVGCLAVGLYLFSRRQQLQPDDGFLAITLYSIRHFFRGRTDDDASANGTNDSAMAKSRFWGPAVRKFGAAATEGPVAVFKIISVFVLVSVFWAMFDQHATTWIEQAKSMKLTFLPSGEPFSFTIPIFDKSVTLDKVLPTQIPALNPLLVMILIPVMNLVYVRFDRLGIKTTPLRRMAVGMALAAVSFVAIALIQMRIDKEEPGQVWYLWQAVPYFIMTVAEVMVSITGLEFAYTQAPPRMKSTIMGFLMLSVSLGNVLVAVLTQNVKWDEAGMFWLYAWLGFGAAALFALRAMFYVPKDYTQE